MATDGALNTKQVWNLPNILTMVRIVLVPLLMWFLIAGGAYGVESGVYRWLALVVFAVAMYTDKLDGDIARARGIVTDFGKIADPIADKLLTGVAFIVLSALGELWWWVTVVILVREWGITLMRLALVRVQVMPASRGGKIKTVFQTAGLIVLLAPLVDLVGLWWLYLGWGLVLIAMAITVITGIDYVIKAIQLRGTTPEKDQASS
ncbi:CDP-diacylglycerol--glycerol-3-phosphate 3-phosphatidyltransferase [Auritidibacter ignavus]|uniref:CDP-diacylglycerol--glycerol-3-phosphate 3-phosphatidyltransferase n=1 Tax=Auritidibacter ignavus TaxID=678932 RepID=UPI002449EB59|nr:CDP-diacylglycerol--glycerol-3-phosphate 3-phosphatidyltransferase [Auritidibacter ignavus]WGH84705.1 CDP-diacylglycerol--glycerol-3-phosphate 3-phosphatidyltransferase [Auritidibacter ignavus]